MDMEIKKKQFGLIGKNIGYSFSKSHFTEKFTDLHLRGYSYENFDIPDISQLPEIIARNPDLKGLNVTIPYKENVISYLDLLSRKAAKIGAVNTIEICKSGKLKGYNTDCYGFRKSLEPLLLPHHKKALILGTGGASKAVAFALRELEIPYTFVSRENKENVMSYGDIDGGTFEEHQLIINCTPLGTSPDTDKCAAIPYDYFTDRHIAFDLIYNPSETLFLKKARSHGATIKNGLEMLELQAEKAWEIWNR